MPEITKETIEKYSLSEKELYMVEQAFEKITDIFMVMKDYCEHNREDKKIYPLISLLEQIQINSKIVSDNLK